MFVKVKDGKLEAIYKTITDFRRDHSNVSFPKEISNNLLESYGVYPVVRKLAPEFDSLVQSLVIQNMPMEENGIWTIGYDVVQKPEEMASSNIRRERDRRLAETDWMALSDNTLSAEWATYRQELRDITSQDGFPYNITWPEKP